MLQVTKQRLQRPTHIRLNLSEPVQVVVFPMALRHAGPAAFAARLARLGGRAATRDSGPVDRSRPQHICRQLERQIQPCIEIQLACFPVDHAGEESTGVPEPKCRLRHLNESHVRLPRSCRKAIAAWRRTSTPRGFIPRSAVGPRQPTPRSSPQPAPAPCTMKASRLRRLLNLARISSGSKRSISMPGATSQAQGPVGPNAFLRYGRS